MVWLFAAAYAPSCAAVEMDERDCGENRRFEDDCFFKSFKLTPSANFTSMLCSSGKRQRSHHQTHDCCTIEPPVRDAATKLTVMVGK